MLHQRQRHAVAQVRRLQRVGGDRLPADEIARRQARQRGGVRQRVRVDVHQAEPRDEHAGDGRELVAAIDARMGEVYLGRFATDGDGLVSARGAEVLVAPDAARADVPFDALGIGSGFAAVAGVLVARLGLVDIYPDALPHAAALARLAARDFIRGQAIAADALEPAYLRDRVALTLVEQGKA